MDWGWVIVVVIIIGLVVYADPHLWDKVTGKVTSVITEFNIWGYVDFSDLINNTENYVGKEFKIKGKYEEAVSLSLFSAGDINYYLLDNKGYKIKINDCIEGGREYFYEENYLATGTIDSYEICECQQRFVVNITEEIWQEFLSIYPQVTKDDVSVGNSNYLFLPSPEEGWHDLFDIDSSRIVLDCIEPSVFLKRHDFKVYIDEIINERTKNLQYATLSTEIIKEVRCEPGSEEKIYYFKCLEPMKKLD